ncbi:tautomerase family protein [Zhihengliuella halotolerans]|uniref:Tautomerase-like protein n=1 Tax=Zhihengliuella halotolerans TaxID=370736 RepID=A0A4Q8AAR1_9MICC|nr:tautomerase family protein [Zhihengliuella halotolerans]RZU60635.1 tautomerase-like protein [Zhihengliuella halotolerans]
MPLVRIDLAGQRPDDEVGAISRAVHDAIVTAYGIPERDYFHIVTEHPTGRIIAQDAGLGFERSGAVVMIQIFTQRGRDRAAKQALYDGVAASLERVGVAGEDIFLGYVENGPEDWSFGFGRAQYLTGELAVPGGSGV